MKRAYGEAIAAAAAFGLAAPLAKRLVGEVAPLVLSGLLYLGAGALLLVAGAVSKSREAPLRRADAPKLIGVIAAGGLAGPLLLLYGLAHTSGMISSLLLNLEAVFTVLIAAAIFGEHVGRRGVAALLAVVAGAVVVGGLSDGKWGASPLGALAVAAACAAWAVDNNLTRALADRSPVAIVTIKGLAAGSLSFGAGLLLGAPLPDGKRIGAALLVGAVGWGASLLLYVRALRTLGAARTGALFATAPFVGALAAFPILGERPQALLPVGGGLMAVGVILLLSERHGHPHTHPVEQHEHLHVHDDHHQHAHDGSEGPEPHAHPHRHDELTHDHPHADDIHHRHRH